MDVKMHLTIPVRHHRVLHLGTIGISSWMTLCCVWGGVGGWTGIAECLPLSAGDISEFWQPEMCQTPLEVAALSEIYQLRSGSHCRLPLLPQSWSFLANQQMRLVFVHVGMLPCTGQCFIMRCVQSPTHRHSILSTGSSAAAKLHFLLLN